MCVSKILLALHIQHVIIQKKFRLFCLKHSMKIIICLLSSEKVCFQISQKRYSVKYFRSTYTFSGDKTKNQFVLTKEVPRELAVTHI